MAILKDLIVHGSSRFLNKVYAEELETSAFEADSAIIKKLKADEATVVGLLDVQGQLHTSSWTNSNIATIDGSFYITPTISSSEGTVINISSATISFAPKTNEEFAVVNSLYYYDTSAHVGTWLKYSKVLITGEILLKGEWTPLGTILGYLNANGTENLLVIAGAEDNKHRPSSVLAQLVANGITTSEYRNLKVSIYQRSNSEASNADGNKYPLGIFMTAMGTNGKTFIDIYGGGEPLKTDYGGYADPNVRIGNLSGLPAITGSISPQGWGIYTTNGYFRGVIVSSAGNIGGWSIGTSGIYNGIKGITTTGSTAGTFIGIGGISNYKDTSTYVNIQNGVITAKGVNLTGQITATKGTIGGASIENGILKVGNANINDINASKITAGDIAAARIQTNLISAINAKVSDISALTATLGGFQVDATAIHTKNVAITSNADNSIALSSTDFTRTINNISRGGLRFAIGDKLGITGDGIIYASSVDLTGKITATSGEIGGINITNGKLDVSAINIGDLSGEIGGRNLLYNSASMPFVSTGIKGWRSSGGTASHIDISSPPMAGITGGIRCTNSGSSAARIGIAQDALTNRFITGKKYSMGFWIRANTSFTSDVAPQPIWGATGQTTGNKNFNMTLTTNWQYVSYEGATLAGTQRDTYSAGYVYASNVPAGGYIQICGIKLQEGEKSTTWTPAPEDVDVAKYITAIDQNGIKIHAENNKSSNYTNLTADGLYIYQNAKEIAKFSSTEARIGLEAQSNVKINKDGITINKGSTQIASYKDSIILGDEANNNLLFLDKSSLSLRSGGEDYLSSNEVFEVGECAETISKTVTSGQASYQWSELTNNTKEIKEITLSEVLLKEGVDYTFNSTTGTITLTNAPTNSTSKLKVSFIPMNPEAIQKTITFTTPEEEYWLLRSLYSIPQHVVNIFSISLNGTVLTSNQYSYDSSTHILKIPATPTESNAPAAGSTVEVVYTKSLGYYYTLGKRDLTKIGDYSIATGYNCMAAGDKSFAGGNYTYVAGQSSFGYGSGTSDTDCVQVIGNFCGGIGRGVTVYGEGNFGCGNYNAPSSNYIFSVGNGSSTTDRKNAFWVAKSGNARVAGNLSVMNGIQVAGQMRSYKKDGSGTVPLFWYDTKRKSNISISANNVNSGLTCDITLPNHTPMGVVGMRILNSSSSGTNAQYCNLYIYMIVNNSSEDHITFSIKNFASTAAKVDVEFKILYIANEALSSSVEW